ncbi:MAG: hypothetical protein M0R06_02575 [Sphaerochaeta sp.]|jgi:hypothetical protein|nr:hypothetical protein [Sphaerochaeta sp.]
MSQTFYGNIYICDTAGTVVTDKPILVKKVVLYPNADGDTALLKFWDPQTKYDEESGTYSSSTIKGTITSGTTLTMASGTLLPNTVLDGDVFKITNSETGVNEAHGAEVVTTAGNNTVVVCANAAWTNEASKWYHFISYPTRTAFALISQDVNLAELDFGDGFWLPNLTLETLSSSAKVYIYV